MIAGSRPLHPDALDNSTRRVCREWMIGGSRPLHPDALDNNILGAKSNISGPVGRNRMGRAESSARRPRRQPPRHTRSVPFHSDSGVSGHSAVKRWEWCQRTVIEGNVQNME